MTQPLEPIVVNLPSHHLAGRASSDVAIFPEIATRLDRLPAIVAAFQCVAQDADWLVFMFDTEVRSARTSDPTINLQFAVQDGVLGLEWVLLGERNRADRQRVRRFAKANGHVVATRRVNGVSYLRIEDGDLVALGLGITREVYRLPEDYAIGGALDLQLDAVMAGPHDHDVRPVRRFRHHVFVDRPRAHIGSWPAT